jgi:TolB-like protein
LKSTLQFLFLWATLSTHAFGQSETVAILPFQTGGEADSATANAITGFVQNAFVESKVFHVIERAQIQKVLDEQRLQLTGLTKDAVEVGKLLAASKMVVGQVTKLGKNYTLILNLVDVTSGEVSKSQKRSAQVAIEDIDNELVEPTVEQLLSVKERSGFTLTIVRGTGIEKMDVLTDTDAWIQVTVGNRLIGRTEVVKDNNSPVFNERIDVSEYAGEPIILTVYDHDVTGERQIGNVTIREPKSGRYPIIGTVNGQNLYRGQVEVVID